MRLLGQVTTAVVFAFALAEGGASAQQAASTRQTAAAVECVAFDWGTGKRGEAALLRNKCSHEVNLAVCFSNPTPGSTTELIACERGLFKTWTIEAKGAAMIDQTDGERYHWRACQPPFSPRLWWDATLTGDSRSQGICEKW